MPMSPLTEKELIDTIEVTILNERNRLWKLNGTMPNVLVLNEYTYILLKIALRPERWEQELGTEIVEWYGMKLVRLEPKQMVHSLGLWFSFGTVQLPL